MAKHGVRHLSNDGIQISPPSHLSHQGASGVEQALDPHQLFTDLDGCNIGFKNFHPMPVTQKGGRLSGQSDMGGVWEWTSSALERYEGFEAMKLYPAYTGICPRCMKGSVGSRADALQMTSSTVSTTSCSVDHGPLILALRAARLCEFPFRIVENCQAERKQV